MPGSKRSSRDDPRVQTSHRVEYEQQQFRQEPKDADAPGDDSEGVAEIVR